jgi:hypothetical protein
LVKQLTKAKDVEPQRTQRSQRKAKKVKEWCGFAGKTKPVQKLKIIHRHRGKGGHGEKQRIDAAAPVRQSQCKS